MHQIVVSRAASTPRRCCRRGSACRRRQRAGDTRRKRGARRVGSTGYSQFKKEIGWRVPIGTREFLQVDQIHNWRDANENIPVNELAIDFSWRWLPNEFGDAFDSESQTYASFPDTVQEAAKNWGVA